MDFEILKILLRIIEKLIGENLSSRERFIRIGITFFVIPVLVALGGVYYWREYCANNRTPENVVSSFHNSLNWGLYGQAWDLLTQRKQSEYPEGFDRFKQEWEDYKKIHVASVTLTKVESSVAEVKATAVKTRSDGVADVAVSIFYVQQSGSEAVWKIDAEVFEQERE